MSFHTKKDFAALCGKTTNWLSVYIKRRKVNLGAGDLIDDSDDINRAFLQKYMVPADQQAPASTKAQPVSKSEKATSNGESATTDPESNIIIIDLNEIPALTTSERLLKYLDTKKREREVEKLELDIEKKRGEVVPVEPIGQLVFAFKQFVLTQQKLSYEKFLAEIGHKYAIASDDLAYYRGFFIKELNHAIVEASTEFDRNIESILSEFAIKKGVGERG